VVIDAIDDSSDLVPVAQSFRGFTAALVCKRVLFDLMVLLAAMIPTPGEARTTMGPTPKTPCPGEGKDATTRMTSRRRPSPPSSGRSCRPRGGGDVPPAAPVRTERAGLDVVDC